MSAHIKLADLYQSITDVVVSDPDAAKVYFGLGKTPNAAWLKKIEPGALAAQKLVDEYLGQAAVGTAPEQAPQPLPEENFGLTPAAPEGKVAELVEKLRARLRVATDAPAEAVLAAVLAGAWARRAIMLTPLSQPVLPWVHFSHMAHVRTQPWLGYLQETDTIIQVARNKLAHMFLASEAEWSWWVDGDILPSYGDPSMFYDVRRLGVPQSRVPQEFLRVKALERLLSHKKTIVGATYQQRRKGGKLCTPADLRPQPSMDERDAVADLRKNGPRDKLLEVDWCATGCLLVHRSVYEDIQKKRPDLAPRQEGAPWNFFGHEVGQGGEDAAFGKLAALSGHQSYLDLGCWVAHVGNYAFMPE